MNEFEHIKLISTGHVIEIYEVQKKPFNPNLLMDLGNDDYNSMVGNNKKKIKEFRDELKSIIDKKEKNREDRKEERRAQTLRDARNKVRRYALANFDSNDCFVTLTYAENFQDIGQADKDFKAFIRKFKKFTGLNKDMKYLGVREFQRRGAIHYHFLVNWKYPSEHVDNEPYIQHLERTVAELWGNGFVDIKALNKSQSKNKKYNGKPVDNIGAYISKYMSKEYDDNRLKGHKAYLCSKGLEKPITYTGDDALKIIEILGLNEKKEIFTNSYKSEYLGKITYKEYNMKRTENN